MTAEDRAWADWSATMDAFHDAHDTIEVTVTMSLSEAQLVQDLLATFAWPEDYAECGGPEEIHAREQAEPLWHRVSKLHDHAAKPVMRILAKARDHYDKASGRSSDE